MGFHHEQKTSRSFQICQFSFPSPFPLHFVSNSSFTPGDEPSVSPGDLELPRHFAEPRPARAIGESDAWRTGKISEAKKRREMRAPRPCQVFGFLYIYIWVWINTYRYIFSGMNIHLPAILMFTRGTRFWHTAIHIYIYQQSTKKTQMHQSYIHIHIYLPLYWLILTMILALDMASRGLLHLWPQP